MIVAVSSGRTRSVAASTAPAAVASPRAAQLVQAQRAVGGALQQDDVFELAGSRRGPRPPLPPGGRPRRRRRGARMLEHVRGTRLASSCGRSGRRRRPRRAAEVGERPLRPCCRQDRDAVARLDAQRDETARDFAHGGAELGVGHLRHSPPRAYRSAARFACSSAVSRAIRQMVSAWVARSAAMEVVAVAMATMLSAALGAAIRDNP